MKIWICGKEEDWTYEKVNREMPGAKKTQQGQMKKDFDEAWMSQWAANQTVGRLDLIQQILAEPFLNSEATMLLLFAVTLTQT